MIPKITPEDDCWHIIHNHGPATSQTLQQSTDIDYKKLNSLLAMDGRFKPVFAEVGLMWGLK